MTETLSRLLWFTIVASAIAYVTYLIAGNIVNAQAADLYRPVIIRDELGQGVHHLSGMVMVPSPCDELSVRTEEITQSSYMLVFRTWREPSMECADEEMPRYFRAQLFAPSVGITLTASLDGKSFPIEVLPVLP